MPFYSAFTSAGRLTNCLSGLLETREMSSFQLSRLAGVSPTTARNIYNDGHYIPSPDVLERICLALSVQPGDLLKISSKIEEELVTASGV